MTCADYTYDNTRNKTNGKASLIRACSYSGRSNLSLGELTMTRSQLTDILFGGCKPHTFHDANGRVYIGVLDSVQCEDGSGRCFNLTINQGGAAGHVTFFVRIGD